MELRAVQMEDSNLFNRWENDMTLWEVGLSRRPLSRFAIEQYVMEAQNESFYSSRQMRLMIDVSEQGEKHTVGCIDLYDFEPENLKAGVGILIAPEYRGKGYSTQALRLLCNYASRNFNLNQLYAFISCDNVASKRTFLSAGFEKTATLRSWIYANRQFKDVEVYQKLDNQEK